MDEFMPPETRDEPRLSFSKSKSDRPGSPDSSHSRSSSLSKNSLQDRLFTKLLQQVIPKDDDEDETESGDKAFASSPKKPAFSLPVMANNFRRFNARIGVVFLFQSQVERVLTWETPTHTLSLLFVYSFICLDPRLLLILPLVVLLLFIMVPAFVTRHPPPPNTSTSSTTPYYSYDGPALAPARTIKPAPETSKDFLRNMRDLQNVMADFSDVHDATVSVVAPLTNFSNEKLSSALFLGCTVATVVLFISAHLLPVKLVLLVGGNAAILSIHPTVRQSFVDLMQDMAGDSLDTDSIADDEKTSDGFASMPANPSAAMSSLEKLADISLDTDPEEREVEIFEVQHRAAGTSESGWESFLFSPAPYDPLSPSRIAGDRPRGCRFFEDVRAPSGWNWKSKKWELDLDCREWVVERMITGVGFEVPGVTAEGNAIVDEVGGWVWDLPPARSQDTDDELPLAYGDLPPESPLPKEKKKSTKDKEKKSSGRDWEEGTPTSFGVGEWRRRRWVRVVQRISLPPAGVLTYSTLSSPNRN
ncbi:hypothetical protein N7499_000956 [Penicillium canescens]|uniref:TECPR1-like DysF domain-containing protein n=1 Tax=Penicillium canescens TaxID=5083 RepID=A0AAD6I264_PENCN|nr:hypothetical protein N7522_004106 [Penicillium canescens]KAJ6027500.1 hypothetical protein N7460_012317 [Penicillium canescens]KAJ6040776.1 hypothetical protein N7444_009681 [Penicillium canescens]KAJ6101326.1 hypothetical protein N7499_000956 [Penicillium canescens]KAJ6173784.1 hypothetical protein N7485_006596 [Penicillium canescens]